MGMVSTIHLGNAIGMTSVTVLELHDFRFTEEALTPKRERWRTILSGMNSLSSIPSELSDAPYLFSKL
jgi:hypothetical protein